MKKFIFMAVGFMASIAVMAQTTATRDVQKEKTMKDLRNDVRAHEATQKEVGSDIVHFRIHQAFQDHQLVTRTHKMVDADRRKAKAEGIDHPITQARRAVHAEDRRSNG